MNQIVKILIAMVLVAISIIATSQDIKQDNIASVEDVNYNNHINSITAVSKYTNPKIQ